MEIIMTMWKKLIALSCITLSAQAVAVEPSTSKQQITELKITEQPLVLESCHIKGIKEQVKCGTLSVPENYQAPKVNAIDINLVVLPSLDRTSEAVPLMFLAGGPGQAATELAAHIRQTFSQIRKQRDIILVDQRGTGKSNALICEEANLDTQNVYTAIEADLTREQVSSCLTEFHQDLSQYNTENAIRDFDAVRAALGHQQINLYGGSYGTRAGLVYMRMFPGNIRGVILDSVGPIEVPIGLFGLSGTRSFDLLVEHCMQEAACQKAFPELKADFQKVFEGLKQSPVETTIVHPRLGTPVTFKIDVQKFVSTIQMQLYQMQMRTMVPLVISEAAKGNYLPLAGLAAMNDKDIPQGGVYSGVLLNIVCNEDFPRITLEQWSIDAKNDYSQNVIHRALRFVCPLWPKYRPSEDFYQPITNDIPTLILSGNLDPVTPPSNGEKPDATLPNSKHIVVEYAAHIVASTECGVSLVDQFLKNLSFDDVDESCVADLPPESFMTSLNGNI